MLVTACQRLWQVPWQQPAGKGLLQMFSPSNLCLSLSSTSCSARRLHAFLDKCSAWQKQARLTPGPGISPAGTLDAALDEIPLQSHRSGAPMNSCPAPNLPLVHLQGPSSTPAHVMLLHRTRSSVSTRGHGLAASLGPQLHGSLQGQGGDEVLQLPAVCHPPREGAPLGRSGDPRLGPHEGLRPAAPVSAEDRWVWRHEAPLEDHGEGSLSAPLEDYSKALPSCVPREIGGRSCSGWRESTEGDCGSPKMQQKMATWKVMRKK